MHLFEEKVTTGSGHDSLLSTAAGDADDDGDDDCKGKPLFAIADVDVGVGVCVCCGVDRRATVSVSAEDMAAKVVSNWYKHCSTSAT
jgi:hypothetical protein